MLRHGANGGPEQRKRLAESREGVVNVTGVVLVIFALVVVAVIAYRAGYVQGQDELNQWHGSTAAEGEALCMTPVLPRWRRLTGWAAYGFAGLLNCLFLGLGFLYFKRWGWAVALAAWVFWFALFVGVIWLAEWCWRPSREAQARLRQKQIEILRALEGRAKEEDQT
jgi:hypothetical protein